MLRHFRGTVLDLLFIDPAADEPSILFLDLKILRLQMYWSLEK